MSEIIKITQDQLQHLVATQDAATVAQAEAEAAMAIAQRDIARAITSVGQPVKLSAVCFACGCVYRRASPQAVGPCPACQPQE